MPAHLPTHEMSTSPYEGTRCHFLSFIHKQLQVSVSVYRVVIKSPVVKERRVVVHSKLP